MDYSKNNLWKWILLYIVIGAIAYGAIYYFFYNKGGYAGNYQAPITNSQTAGWKTYTNDTYGFEIKHPNNISFTEYPLGNIWNIAFGDNNNPNNQPLLLNIVRTEGSGTEIKDNKIAGNAIIGDKSIGGSIGKITTYGSAHCREIILYKNQLSYLFIDNCEANIDVFNLMISTFKFTK